MLHHRYHHSFSTPIPIHMTEKPFLTTIAKKCKTLIQFKQLHAHILRSRIKHAPYSLAPLLYVLSTSNDSSFTTYTSSIFHHLPHRNTFMYNTMIKTYLQSHSPTLSLSCYITMLQNDVAVNNFTFPPLIKSCTALITSSNSNSNSNLNSRFITGRLVHAHVVELGLIDDPYIVSAFIEFYSVSHEVETARVLFDRTRVKDVVLWTAMIDGYGKIGNLKSAREMFDEMPERNVVSWSAMMAAYSRVSEFREVLGLFGGMQSEGVKPNESVLVTVVTACANLGALTQGMWVHSYARRFGLDRSNRILATALVDMYSKCGCVELALTVFEGIVDRDAGAWNAMISGVALNGDVRKSLELFREMTDCGTRPNETTFVAVLTACTHAKMVQLGLRLFGEMSSVYGVVPCAEHYACVVDLLSRAGMVEEAERFIEKMGGFAAGDPNVWGAILNACRIHKNISVGDRVWKKLVDMGVTDCGTHVLTYNIYKEAGWDAEANRVRSMISEAGMKKKPGCSVIEVDDEVEEFLAGDRSHPQAREMCRLLDSILKMENLEHL